MPSRSSSVAWLVVSISCASACGRLGYPSHGRSGEDGGSPLRDGSSRDATPLDATALDASARDAHAVDGGTPRDATGIPDAARDAREPSDAGPDSAVDASLPEPVCMPGAARTCGMGGFQRCSPAGTWCQCNGDSASGSPGGWVGCRGNGLAVCSELVAGYPCYWENHPRCARNDTCEGSYFTCNRDCPAPDAADACTCALDPAGWLGCGSACGVCAAVLDSYPCYFVNHWACEPEACGPARARCDSKCPAPTDADRGSTLPAP